MTSGILYSTCSGARRVTAVGSNLGFGKDQWPSDIQLAGDVATLLVPIGP